MNGECEEMKHGVTLTSDVLKDLDTLLRCGICFEYMKTAMLLPTCSHNYCSLCIRRYICYKEQCPTCRKHVLESDLRNNRLLDEIVALFQREKQLINDDSLNSLKPASKTSSVNGVLTSSADDKQRRCDDDLPELQSKETVILSDNDCDFESTSDSLRESSTAGDKRDVAAVNGNADDQCFKPSLFTARSPLSITSLSAAAAGSSQSSSSTASTLSHSVSCPVCNVSVTERSINMHLDRCLKTDGSELSTSLSKTPKRKPLPKLVYNLLSDKELRRKLVDVGLPTHGHRKTMIERHREYTLIYNAECDSLNPKSGSDIVHEMLRAEENKSSSFTSPGSAMLRVDKSSSVNELETARKSYARQHKSQFEQLIEAARRNRAGVQKVAGDSEDVVKHDSDVASSTSSVELIADTDLLSFDAVPTDDNHNLLVSEQAVDDAVTVATSSCPLTDEPLVQLDNNVVNSDLSNSLPATQVDNDEIAAADHVGDNDDEDDERVQSPDLLSFLDDIDTSANAAARASSLSADQSVTVKPDAQTKNRRRKLRQRDDDDDDVDDSKEMLESTVTTRRCLRERRKKCRKLSEVDDDNNSDNDYEPESVSVRPKRRKSRRH